MARKSSRPEGDGLGSATQPSTVTLESASANLAGKPFMWLVLAVATGQKQLRQPARQQRNADGRKAPPQSARTCSKSAGAMADQARPASRAVAAEARRMSRCSSSAGPGRCRREAQSVLARSGVPGRSPERPVRYVARRRRTKRCSQRAAQSVRRSRRSGNSHAARPDRSLTQGAPERMLRRASRSQ